MSGQVGRVFDVGWRLLIVRFPILPDAFLLPTPPTSSYLSTPVLARFPKATLAIRHGLVSFFLRPLLLAYTAVVKWEWLPSTTQLASPTAARADVGPGWPQVGPITSGNRASLTDHTSCRNAPAGWSRSTLHCPVSELHGFLLLIRNSVGPHTECYVLPEPPTVNALVGGGEL